MEEENEKVLNFTHLEHRSITFDILSIAFAFFNDITELSEWTSGFVYFEHDSKFFSRRIYILSISLRTFRSKKKTTNK